MQPNTAEILYFSPDDEPDEHGWYASLTYWAGGSINQVRDCGLLGAGGGVGFKSRQDLLDCLHDRYPFVTQFCGD